jgi:CheY-like chemotaxis protein
MGRRVRSEVTAHQEADRDLIAHDDARFGGMRYFMAEMADSLALSNPLVLIVGPDRHSREPYALCAEAADLRVEQAHNALQALDKATALRPDVILTDLALSYGMDGITLCRRLGVEASTKSIPILAVARDHPTEIAEATAAGCTAVLVKPCSPERLLVEIIWVLVRTRNDGPMTGSMTVRFLTRSLRNALDKNARLATENADLTASALLWADWYGQAIERANIQRESHQGAIASAARRQRA